jgi:tetratricopeptide (TPR) repeat protein
VGAFLAVLFWLAQAANQISPDKLIAGAVNHLRERRFDDAVRDLTRAAALQPRSAAVHLLLGQAYLGKGTPELIAQAKAEFQEARDLDGSEVLPSFYIAKIDLDLGRISQAERELLQALERKPGEHYLLGLLGEVRRRRGKVEEAIELTTKAAASGPDAIPVLYYRALAYWDRKDGARALADLQRVIGSPFASVEAFVAAGVIHLHGNRLTEAEQFFRKAVGLGPDRAEPRLRLAQTLRRQRRFDLAKQELDRAEAAPQLSSEYFQKLAGEIALERGLILADQGDPAGARVWFQRALEMDPANAEAQKALRP